MSRARHRIGHVLSESIIPTSLRLIPDLLACFWNVSKPKADLNMGYGSKVGVRRLFLTQEFWWIVVPSIRILTSTTYFQFKKILKPYCNGICQGNEMFSALTGQGFFSIFLHIWWSLVKAHYIINLLLWIIKVKMKDEISTCVIRYKCVYLLCPKSPLTLYNLISKT